MLGDPCRAQAQGDRCDRRSVRPLHPVWHSRSHPLRQRTGVRGQGRAGMDRVCRCQDRLHRAGQSLGEWLHRELQRAPSRRAARRRNLLLTPRGPNRHRELAAPLQHDQAARLTWIQATGTGGIRARLRRVAGCAIPSGSAGHAGETANLKLTFHLDHSEGADQYAMMKIPPEKDFGGSTDIPKNITRETWRQRMGNVDCIGCHQLGQESTRTIPAQFGEFKTGAEAWMRRVGSGQTGEFMVNRLAGQLGGVPFQYFGEWTDRVAKGELPKSKPPRPQGVERNVVVTSWEWGTEKTFIHHLISSDRRYPPVNGYGPLYSSNEYSSDDMSILDPKTHKVTFFKMPVADPNAPESFGPPFHASAMPKPTQPSAYWGDEKIWSQRANNHNGM